MSVVNRRTAREEVARSQQALATQRNAPMSAPVVDDPAPALRQAAGRPRPSVPQDQITARFPAEGQDMDAAPLGAPLRMQDMAGPLEQKHAAEAEKIRREARPLQSLAEARKVMEALNEYGVDGLGTDVYDRGTKKVQEFMRNNPEIVTQLRREKMIAENILTDAVPTGNAQIDSPELYHRARARRGWDPQKGRLVTEQEILQDSQNFQFDPVSKEGIIQASANEGVDYRRGLPFNAEFQKAANLGTPGVQMQVQNKILKDITAGVPEGMPTIRVNAQSGHIEYMRAVGDEDVRRGYEPEENKGKYRWTAIDPAHFTPQQLGGLFDFAEAGSILGGVAGSLATKNLTFFKTVSGQRGSFLRGTAGLGSEGVMGLTGRELGNMLKLAVTAFNGHEIDPDEALAMFQTDLGVEAAAAMFGRAGSKALDTFKFRAQNAEARITGRQIVSGNIENVADRNAARLQTARDAQQINRELAAQGRQEKVTPTPGQAETQFGKRQEMVEGPSGQTERLQQEEAQRVNIASPIKAAANTLREQENRSALRLQAESFEEAADDMVPDAIRAANRDGTQIRVSAVEGDTTRGRIHPQGLPNDPDGSVNGILFQVDPTALRIVGADLPKNLQGIGLGADMYRSFINLSHKEGRDAVSGGSVTREADRVWQSLHREGFKVRKNPNATFVPADAHHTGPIKADTPGSWTTGNPLESVWIAPGPTREVATTIIGASKGYKVKQDGTPFKQNALFDNFMKDPAASVLSAVAKSASDNRSVRADLIDGIRRHHDLAAFRTNKNGKVVYDEAQKQEWMKRHGTTLNKIFTPEELVELSRDPSFLSKHADALVASKDNLNVQMGAILKTADPDKLIAEPGTLLKRLNGMPPKEQKRALRVLEAMNPEAYQTLRGELSKEIKDAAYKPIAAVNANRQPQQTFGKWLTKNAPTIKEVMGEEYYDRLGRFNRSVGRDAVTQGIKSPKTPVNSTIMMASRTIFGALSDWQRRMTTARRIQVERWYAKVLDVVSDPEKLAVLESLDQIERRLEPGSRALVNATIRLGLVDSEEEYNEWKQFALEMGSRSGVEDE